MKTIISLLLLLTLISLSSADAQNSWVAFTKDTPEEPTVTLLQSNTSSVVFSIQTPGMYANEIVIDEDENGNKSNAVELEPVFMFSVSPNPAINYFVVEYNLATKDFATAEMRMFNKNGKQVYKQKLT